MTSTPGDLISGDAALDESGAERIRRAVAVLGRERAAALVEEARARAASDGDPEAGAAPAEALALHFFDLVWERTDPAYVRWIFAPPEPPEPPVDDDEDFWPPPRDRPAPILVVGVGLFAVAEHLFAALIAASSQAFQGFSLGDSCDCLSSDVAPAKDWAYQPITWILWPLVLVLIVACLVSVARSQSGWRWTRWLAALLAPWAWLILVNVAFRAQVG